jgi:hypothetical protein
VILPCTYFSLPRARAFWLLSDNGIEIFHAKKFRHGEGQFKHWSKSKKSAFHAKFTQIIDENLERGFFAILTPSEYQAIYKDKRNPKKIREDTQYGMCFRACLWVLNRFSAGLRLQHEQGEGGGIAKIVYGIRKLRIFRRAACVHDIPERFCFWRRRLRVEIG